ncbi:MAG: ankyrin repeat domain-containing protein [Rudaea sp.]
MKLQQRQALWSGACVLAAALAALLASKASAPAVVSVLLLLTVALWMSGQCVASDRDATFRAFLARSGTYLLLLTSYTLAISVIVGLPLHWLRERGSLGAALAVSGAVMIALLGLWRMWPAFGLVCHDAGKHRSPQDGNLLTRSFAQAWRLTAHNELYFGHGLLVAMSLLSLAQGALSLAGVDAPIAEAYRLPAFAAYALLLAPLANWSIMWCCKNAVVVAHRRSHAGRSEVQARAVAAPPQASGEPELAKGLSPVHLDAMLLRCARAGQIQLALDALAHGASAHCSPAPEDRDQRSVLVLAAVNPDLRLLRGLIAKGADLNRAHAGLAPLIAATRDSHEGRPEAVMTLLTNGARPECTDGDGNTPLHFAALAATPVVAALLCDAGARLDPVNRNGLTPLGIACAGANWDLVEFLLDRGARLEVEHAQPVLLAASSIADDDIRGIGALLKRKARVNARGSLGRTALMTAALHGHVKIAQCLLDAGAQVNLADERGATALMEAARSGAHALLEVLFRSGAEPDRVDSSGRTALIIASQSVRASEETVAGLLALGASPDVVLDDGRRAVDFAAASGRWNIVALLDPAYPRPATLTTPGLEPQSASAHLLDALRFGHWSIADSYSGQIAAWPKTEQNRMFVELIGHHQPAAWRWLLLHGTDVNAAFDDGRTLLGETLARLPDALSAARDIVAAGAQVGGSNTLQRVCVALGSIKQPVQRAALETFAIELAERGAELFATDGAGRTPLMHAVAAGSVRVTQVLLARGVDPDARDGKCRTALFAALTHAPDRAVGLIRELLRAGANPEAMASNGETPLGVALAGSAQDVREWLNWPEWRLPRRRLQARDLVAAAASGDVSAVDKLLALGLPLDATDDQGATALIRAAGQGHAELVEYLTGRGADTSIAARAGATALVAAVSARHTDVVEILITHGAKVDHRLLGGATALMIAAGLGYPELVAQLLAHGADVDTADERGTRALHAAAQFGFADRDVESAKRTLQTLLDAGACVNAANDVGQTALLLLLGAGADVGALVDQKNLLALLQIMLAHQADTQLRDQRGVSVLHACAMHGLLLPARALLAVGADPTCCDGRERTPREVAHLLGFIDIAAELGIDPSIPTPAQTLRAPAFGSK